MIGAQTTALLNTIAKSGAANLATPIRRGAILFGVALIAGFLGVSALVCVGAALWFATAPYIGAAWAAMIAAAFLLAMAMIVFGVAMLTLRGKRKSIAEDPALQIAPILQKLLKEQKTTLLLGALIAGIAAARK